MPFTDLEAQEKEAWWAGRATVTFSLNKVGLGCLLDI